MDANFRLKNQFMSSYSRDPGLGIGMGYMIARGPYERFLSSRTDEADVSWLIVLSMLQNAHIDV